MPAHHGTTESPRMTFDFKIYIWLYLFTNINRGDFSKLYERINSQESMFYRSQSALRGEKWRRKNDLWVSVLSVTVALSYSHGSSYFFWDNYASEVVNAADYSCGFHI